MEEKALNEYKGAVRELRLFLKVLTYLALFFLGFWLSVFLKRKSEQLEKQKAKTENIVFDIGCSSWGKGYVLHRIPSPKNVVLIEVKSRYHTWASMDSDSCWTVNNADSALTIMNEAYSFSMNEQFKKNEELKKSLREALDLILEYQAEQDEKGKFMRISNKKYIN